MVLIFSPFRLDLGSERLWRGEREISIRPKSFAVLRYLAEHPGRLVSGAELLRSVWGGVSVSETMPRLCIQEIRAALGDDARRPRYLETRPRRGYRLIAPVNPTAEPASRTVLEPTSPEAARGADALVGRDAERDQLRVALRQARAGERQVLFVTGEPGIGKTALVESFLTAPGESSPPRVAVGQCVESYGTGDPYLPLLDALERLARGAGGEAIRHALRRHAPAWLAQMPSLVGLDERDALVHARGAPTPQGMLRELAGLVEALTFDQELVFWLEDLHWADHPTLLAIAFLARRREPARLLLLGSYRPTELLGPDHPLTRVKRDLLLHRQAEEVALGPLSESAIAEYLATRLGEGPVSPDLTRHVHARTEGNPLFMVTAVDDLLARGAIRQTDGTWALTGRLTLVVDVPSTVRELIEQQLERLEPEDRQLLEVASAVGVEFAASAVAAGLDQDLERTEARCAELARQGRFIRGRGEVGWPDGTTASRFAFVHAVHQQVLYERIPAGRRSVCHSRIGARLESAYGAAVREIAAELATHAERARDPSRAVRFFRLAGENALGRAAHAEAIAHLSRALSLLEGLPAGRRRVQSELELLVTLGPAWIVARGYAAVEVEQTYQRALALCRQLDHPPELFRALQGLWNVRLVRGDLTGARVLAGEILERARRSRDARLLTRAHAARGETCFHLGQLEAARQHLGRALTLARRHAATARRRQDPRMAAYASWGHWMAGFPDRRPGARRAGPGPGLRPRASAQPRVRPGVHGLARTVLRRGRARRRAGGRGAGTLPGARHPVLAQLGRDARRLGADPPGSGDGRARSDGRRPGGIPRDRRRGRRRPLPCGPGGGPRRRRGRRGRASPHGRRARPVAAERQPILRARGVAGPGPDPLAGGARGPVGGRGARENPGWARVPGRLSRTRTRARPPPGRASIRAARGHGARSRMAGGRPRSGCPAAAGAARPKISRGRGHARSPNRPGSP